MATYEKECVIDNVPFTTKRRDKQTCSPACQKKLQRQGGMTVISQVLGEPTTDSLVPEDDAAAEPQGTGETVVGFDPGSPEGDKATLVVGDKNPDGSITINHIARGPVADTFLDAHGVEGSVGKVTPAVPIYKIASVTVPATGETFAVMSEGLPVLEKAAPKRAKKSVAGVEPPIDMATRMSQITQRMNERLRAKGLPLIMEKPMPEYFVPTGIGELDALTAQFDAKGSGGFPRKKITEIYGPKGVGKSSLVKTIMKMNPELRVLFFDAEGGMVAPPANMRVVKGNIVEDIMDILIDSVESQEFDLIIVDSIASLITRKQYDGDPEGKAAMARTFGPYVKKLVAALQPLKDGLPDPTPGTSVVFINQFRSTTQSFGLMEYTVGGKAMEYYASLRLEFRSAKSDYIFRDKKLAGQQVRVKVEKTRYGPKDVEFKFPIMFADMQDYNEEYIKTLKEMGLR